MRREIKPADVAATQPGNRRNPVRAAGYRGVVAAVARSAMWQRYPDTDALPGANYAIGGALPSLDFAGSEPAACQAVCAGDDERSGFVVVAPSLLPWQQEGVCYFRGGATASASTLELAAVSSPGHTLWIRHSSAPPLPVVAQVEQEVERLVTQQVVQEVQGVL